jgi:hypothetical protein
LKVIEGVLMLLLLVEEMEGSLEMGGVLVLLEVLVLLLLVREMGGSLEIAGELVRVGVLEMEGVLV